MIAGTGIDIVDVRRIEEKLMRNDALLRKIFSEKEIVYCNANVHPYQHFAGRFAVKEAFLKATGLGLTAGLDLYDVEVISSGTGQPQLVLRGDFEKLASDKRWKMIHVSIAHTETAAVASVIIEI